MTSKLELDRQANLIARSFTGEFAWFTVVFGLLVAACYVATIVLTMTGSLHLWLGYLSAALLTYAIYTVMHDAVHGSIKGSSKKASWINSAMGYLAGQILFIPFRIHQQEHLAHHRNTNEDNRDPDLFVNGDGLVALMIGSIKAVHAQYKYFFLHSWGNTSQNDKLIVLAEASTMLAWRFAFVFAGFGLEALVLFIGSTLSGLFILVVLFVWLVHRPNHETQRYKNTNTFILPAPLRAIGTWMWLFQNYHSVHHLFPRVPFYRYRELYEKIEPIMIAHQAPIVRL